MGESVTENQKLAYSINEASSLTSLSKSYLRNEIRDGNLKSRKIGRRVLILNEDLQNYLRREEEQNTGENI
jgi:excisionase family DNA binding protein